MLNKDKERRDEIIFGSVVEEYPLGGCKPFHKLSLKQLDLLIKENFIDLNERQNDNAPAVEDFHSFLTDHPDFVLEGYAVSVDRRDYRVSIDGIAKYEGISKEDIIDFAQFYDANEYCIEEDFMRAWWD